MLTRPNILHQVFFFQLVVSRSSLVSISFGTIASKSFLALSIYILSTTLFKQISSQFLQQICVKKCPSSTGCWDSNPQPSEHESPHITPRPGLPPKIYNFMSIEGNNRLIVYVGLGYASNSLLGQFRTLTLATGSGSVRSLTRSATWRCAADARWSATSAKTSRRRIGQITKAFAKFCSRCTAVHWTAPKCKMFCSKNWEGKIEKNCDVFLNKTLSASFYFRLFIQFYIIFFPMTWFEPQTSGIGSNCSTNCTTTNSQIVKGSVVRVFAYDTWGPQVESMSYCWKDENKEKRDLEWPIYKKLEIFPPPKKIDRKLRAKLLKLSSLYRYHSLFWTHLY